MAIFFQRSTLVAILAINFFSCNGQIENSNCGQVILDDAGLSNKCGLSAAAMLSSQVLRESTSGRDAMPGEFPYSALIIGNGSINCFGSVIDDQFILTAAHCLNSGIDYEVLLGANNLANQLECHQQIHVETFSKHEAYNKYSKHNDIAILKLDEPISFKHYENGFGSASKVCLPTESTQIGAEVTTAIWSNDQLKRVSFSNFDCESDHEDRFCIETYFDQGPTSGDSGAAFVQRNEIDYSWMQIGIVSMIKGSADNEESILYLTKVPFFADWIRDRKNELQLQSATMINS